MSRTLENTEDVSSEQDVLAAAAQSAIHINTADGDSEPLQLESMCMRCHETGTTTMLLVSIPHFKDLLLASFECPECGHRNSEVQFAGAYSEKGARHTLAIAKGQTALLGRQLVKSPSATVTIPELEFEIPPLTQKGVITTVEGLLSEASVALGELQPQRRAVDSAAASAIDGVIDQLKLCAAGDRDFTVVLDDPAGCSHIEPGGGPSQTQGAVCIEYYERSAQQSEAIGLSVAPQSNGAKPSGSDKGDHDGDAHSGSQRGAPNDHGQQEERAADSSWEVHHGTTGQQPVGAPGLVQRSHGTRGSGGAAAAFALKLATPEEVMELPGHCYTCGAECETRMFTTTIPHFKEVVIMSNSCDVCGYRDSEVKPGGGFSDQGRIITLKVTEQEDLRRDVIKSDSAHVSIAELDLEMSTGSLGGLITTVEGLLTAVQNSFKQMRSFHLGDSAAPDRRRLYSDFFKRLNCFANLEQPWTLVIRDPLANSFVAPLTADMADDVRLSVEDYARSPSDDEEYGIDHLKQHENADEQAERVASEAADRHDQNSGHVQWGDKSQTKRLPKDADID